MATDTRTLYQLLGVAPDATTQQVRAAHRGLVRTLHPDVSREPDAEQRFGLVQRAYEVLIDRDKRAAYDRTLEHGDIPEPSVVLSPTYSWGNIAGRGAAARRNANDEREEELDELWRVFFEPRARERTKHAASVQAGGGKTHPAAE